jgi:transcriptional regulator with XRE-family HTH domain
MGISQGRLSELERDQGSFYAEHLLLLMKLFNVPASEFEERAPTVSASLEQSLARHGATHAGDRDDVLPSERIGSVVQVVRETLASRDVATLVTALAPVLATHTEDVNFVHLYGELRALGLERRFAWVAENTLKALEAEIAVVPLRWSRVYRCSAIALERFVTFVVENQPHASANVAKPMLDVLDKDIADRRKIEAIGAKRSDVSLRWDIVTALQPKDFATAIRAASNATDRAVRGQKR